MNNELIYLVTSISKNDRYMTDPKYSWYKTPLWNCDAIELQIKALVKENKHVAYDTMDEHYFYIYFTHEEFALFKLSYQIQRTDINLSEIIQNGTIYI